MRKLSRHRIPCQNQNAEKCQAQGTIYKSGSNILKAQLDQCRAETWRLVRAPEQHWENFKYNSPIGELSEVLLILGHLASRDFGPRTPQFIWAFQFFCDNKLFR